MNRHKNKESASLPNNFFRNKALADLKTLIGLIDKKLIKNVLQNASKEFNESRTIEKIAQTKFDFENKLIATLIHRKPVIEIYEIIRQLVSTSENRYKGLKLDAIKDAFNNHKKQQSRFLTNLKKITNESITLNEFNDKPVTTIYSKIKKKNVNNIRMETAFNNHKKQQFHLLDTLLTELKYAYEIQNKLQRPVNKYKYKYIYKYNTTPAPVNTTPAPVTPIFNRLKRKIMKR